jgi:hypothetical protein
VESKVGKDEVIEHNDPTNTVKKEDSEYMDPAYSEREAEHKHSDPVFSPNFPAVQDSIEQDLLSGEHMPTNEVKDGKALSEGQETKSDEIRKNRECSPMQDSLIIPEVVESLPLGAEIARDPLSFEKTTMPLIDSEIAKVDATSGSTNAREVDVTAEIRVTNSTQEQIAQSVKNKTSPTIFQSGHAQRLLDELGGESSPQRGSGLEGNGELEACHQFGSDELEALQVELREMERKFESSESGLRRGQEQAEVQKPAVEHWSVRFARERKSAETYLKECKKVETNDFSEATSLEVALEETKPSEQGLLSVMTLSDEAKQALDQNQGFPHVARKGFGEGFLDQIVAVNSEVIEVQVDPDNGTSLRNALTERTDRKSKKRPPELQGPLFQNSPSPSRSPRECANTQGGDGSQSVVTQQKEVDEPVLKGHGLYGNISLQYEEEQQLKKQRMIEKQQRKDRKKKEEAQKKQERLEKLGIPQRPPPLPFRPAPPGMTSGSSGHGGPKARSVASSSSLPPIPKAKRGLSPIAESSPASTFISQRMMNGGEERTFQGVKLPSVVPTRHVAPASRLPSVPTAGRHNTSLSTSASAPAISFPEGSDANVPPTMGSIEQQKMRLANKMEIFRAAQEQLNNVGNLSSDELRALLKRLHSNKCAQVEDPTGIGGGDRAVQRRLRQVDKFCRNIF